MSSTVARTSPTFGVETRDLVEEPVRRPRPAPGDAEDLQGYARRFVERQSRAASTFWSNRLAAEIDLNSCTNDVDMLLASTDPKEWHPDARRDVLVNYLGFPFWDVLTFPLMTWREVGEFNKILIDRISPQDANTLTDFSGSGSLKGVGFAHFAAFFSRAYRENDYLLGPAPRDGSADRHRLQFCRTTRASEERKEMLALKRRGFLTILDAEEKHLPNSAALIAALRALHRRHWARRRRRKNAARR